MRRSICVTEPTYATAGNSGSWKFIFTTAAALPKGTKMRFDLGGAGRPFDWQVPETAGKKNLIWGELQNGKVINAIAVQNPSDPICPSFEFQLPTEVKMGETFTIHLGKDNACQTFVQRRRPFHLFIDPKGKGDYKDQETFHLDVRGNQLTQLRIIAPSLVTRNKRFDVIVRYEDKHGNLTNAAPEDTLIDLSYEHLRESLSWKLLVPETGYVALPSLYFNEPGVYKIQLRNLKTKETFFSSPIKCIPEGELSLYWGTLHGESKRFDSHEQLTSWLRFMRDDCAMQFVATSSFESEEETSNEAWKSISTNIAEFNEEDRFIAMLGFQWQGEPGEEGLRHFLWAKDAKPILRRKDTKNNSLKKIYKTNSPKEVLSIPTFTMGKTTCYNFEDFNPEYERVVDIYSAWGSSECTAKEGNKRPISGTGKNTIPEAPEGSIVHALNEGCRFGFTASGYDDRGPFSDLYDTTQAQYSPGLTAILAKEHTRASLFEALQARSCYATTGERIILNFNIVSAPMGSELDTKVRPGLKFNRYITGFCVGTGPLTEVAIVRNGKVWKKLPINPAQPDRVDIEIDDLDDLDSLILSPQNKPPFIYYYLRATQADGHMAWSSPIWIEHAPKLAAPAPKKMKKKEL
jgi:hypothetical protein